MADPASLANLRDIALPPPVAWWPPTFGWWVLGGGVLAILLLLLAEVVRRYRANAYRREARRALRSAPASDMASILKRVSLAAYPRREVAGLSGAAWAAFLARTGGFPADASNALERASVDASRPLNVAEARAVLDAADRWIRVHRS